MVAHDPVREAFERRFFAELAPRLLREAGGEGSLLELGCGRGPAAMPEGRYLGVDLEPPPGPGFLRHDLRDGLGPVGPEPYDLYLGAFGIASHLEPGALRRLLADVAAHARPGALVALEALGLFSLEWPRLWDSRPGASRAIPYRLGADVTVHPWAPAELAGLLEESGIRPLRAIDRTLQAGPKAGGGRYYGGLPDVRGALNALLEGGSGEQGLAQRLPPLPAGPAAAVHHALAARRRALVSAAGPRGAELARSVWALEPPTGDGYGHGMLLVGRVS
jgi:hypothetical protein